VLQRCFISYDAHHLYLIHHSSCLTLYSGPHYNASVTLTFQIPSGCRVSRDGGLGVRHVSSLTLPAYLVWRAHSPSRMKFCPDVPAPRTHSSTNTYTCRHGRIPVAICLRLYMRNSLSGITLVLQLTEPWLTQTLVHLSNLPSFEPHRRHTVEIGCLRCPYPRVAFI